MLNKILTSLSSLFFLLTISTGFAHADELTIRHAYIPDAPPMVKVMAAYMTIENTSDKSITITAFSSDAFAKIELHETVMQDGMMSMKQLDKLVIKAKSKIALKPGGKHLMLFERKHPLKLNDKLTITLHSNLGKHAVAVTVKQPDNDTHHHMHH